MRGFSEARLAGLIEQSNDERRKNLVRYQKNAEPIHTRWLIARVLLASVTTVILSYVAEVYTDNWRAPVAVLASVLLHGTLGGVGAGLGNARPETIGPRLLRLLLPVEILVWPIAAPIVMLGNAFNRVADSKIENAAALTTSEVEYLVEDAEKTGEMAAEPAAIIRNVLDFKDLTIRGVMVPRVKVLGIEVDTPLRQVLAVVAQEGHSRYPVFRTQLDNVVGILYVKDLLPKVAAGVMDSVRLADILRTKIFFVTENKPAVSVLQEMRVRRQHLAVCVDEFGGVSGIVTLEDILEEIVGDIRDEHDAEEAPIQDLGGGRLIADAAVSLTDLSAYLGITIEADGDFGSLGGLLTHTAGRVPSIGEHMVIGSVEFVVREADAKRPIKVEIILPPPSSGVPSLGRLSAHQSTGS